MKKAYLIFVSILILVAPLYYYFVKNDVPFGDAFLPGTPIVKIGEVPIRVDIVVSDADRKKGLSNRSSVGENRDGMLFIFPASDTYGIWMKDMRFPIDIIWISAEKKVVHIEKNVEPFTYPKTFYPPVPAKYVVETSAHFTNAFNISVGQEVQLPEKSIESI